MSSGAAAGAAGRAGWGGPLVLAARDIKLSHSVFALPFAVLGVFLARGAGRDGADGDGAGGSWLLPLGLVIACMVLARTWAMLINRVADASLDARNPRTARRAVASGALPRGTALGLACACAAGFVGVCVLFDVLLGNPWPWRLSVPVLGVLAFYSFAKRFTLLCHALLGLALALSPLAAALAVRPGALGDTPALWLLSAMVLCWVAGFDIIYALQDVDVDRREGLHSVPARLGPKRAVWISRGLHALAWAALAGAWLIDPRLSGGGGGGGGWGGEPGVGAGPVAGVGAWVFGVAVGLTAGLLLAEHVVLARRGLAGLPMAFFTLNGVVSCVVGGLGVAALV